MARVGLVVDGGSPLLSVALLLDELQVAARCCADLEVIEASTLDDERAAAVVASNDVIVGVHAAILRQRRRLGRAVPILMPSYGLGTRAMLPLYEAGNLLAVGDGFICPSTADHAAAARHLRGDGLRAHLLPYPMPRHVRGIERAPQRSRSCSLLYVGRVTPQKNVHLLLSCVAALGARGLPVGLTVVGAEDGSSFPEAGWNAGDYSSYLRTLAERLGVADRVRFVGAVAPADVAAHYLNADINITLSTFRTEDFGFVPVEAAAAGLPTVATAWGGFWDTVSPGVSGVHVPVALTQHGPRVDWMAAVDAVETLAGSPRLLEQYGRTAPTWAAGFGPDLFAERFARLIAQVVAQPRGALQRLDVEQCVSPEALAFFQDLARRKPTTKAQLIAARRGTFSDHPERFQQFFAAYVRDRRMTWDAESRPYQVCAGSLRDDRLDVECPLRSYSVALSATQRSLLSVIDGERSVAQLAALLRAPIEALLTALAELTEAGVVLPRSSVQVNPPLIVRSATLADAEGAVAALQGSITTLCVEDHQNDAMTLAHWLRNKTVEHFERWLLEPTNFVTVCHDGAVVCGVGLIDRSGYIRLCYVRPDRQRLGVGRALLSALEAQASHWGLNEIRLGSTATARAFYERHGYVPDGESTQVFGLVRCHPYRKRVPAPAA